MNTSQQLAKHLRDVHFGGNWTFSNMKDVLEDVTWEEAIHKVHSFNTIATLVFHTNYYVASILNVYEGKPLDSKDELSFDHPPINNAEDWNSFVEESLDNVKRCADLIEKAPDEQWFDDFTDKKYGSYYRNILGLIEHTHYHLGQIALIKKFIRTQ